MKNIKFQKVGKWVFVLGTGLFLVLSGCAETGTNEAEDFQILDDNTPVTFDVLNSSVLKPICSRCHDWASSESGISRYIRPGNPEKSILYYQVFSGSMPQGGPKLSEYQLDLVRRYIEGLTQ